MTDRDNGPYAGEREACAAARSVTAPFPDRGILSQEQRAKVLRRVLAQSGVETSAFEDRTAWWLANWEDYVTGIITGWVRRAYEAGRAAGPEDGNPAAEPREDENRA